MTEPAAPRPKSRARRRIPEATVARLPVYLRTLLDLANDHTTTISSERLAELAGVNAAKVRKDLSYLGSYGTRGVGYDVEFLLFQMSRELGLTQDWPVVIVGIGNLGQALANYGGFSDRGFPVAALVDVDPSKVGFSLGGRTIRHIDELPAVVTELGTAIGIIATPATAAQDVADRLVVAGVTSILNFAPALISVPDGISVRKVDLAVELQILSFYQQHRSGRPPAVAVDGGEPQYRHERRTAVRE
jgi:redox-sensing transcriptional repressor